MIYIILTTKERNKKMKVQELIDRLNEMMRNCVNLEERELMYVTIKNGDDGGDYPGSREAIDVCFGKDEHEVEIF